MEISAPVTAAVLAYGRHDRRATLYALANAVVIAAYTLIDAQGARASGAPVGYTLWFFVASGLAIGAVVLAMGGRALPQYLAPVALVAALRETSVIFGAAIGALFLNEKITRRRLLGTGAVVAGLAALRA